MILFKLTVHDLKPGIYAPCKLVEIDLEAPLLSSKAREENL